MGFLCSNNGDAKNVSIKIIEDNILSSELGLNNVFNVKTNMNVCSEKFLSPEYYVTGAELFCECPNYFTGTSITPASGIIINLYDVPVVNYGDCEDINGAIRSARNSVILSYINYGITSATSIHIESTECGKIYKFRSGDEQVWLTQEPNGTTGFYYMASDLDPLNMIKYSASVITTTCCNSLVDIFTGFNNFIITGTTGMTQYLLDVPYLCDNSCCLPRLTCNNIPSTINGCTTGSTSVYNLNYTPTFNVTFNLTGNTEYTGYTGSLCYRVYNQYRFNVEDTNEILTNGTEIIKTCVPYVNIISSSTVTQTFTEGQLPNTWNQYMIRPYYSFETKYCNSGLTFNTWDSTIQKNMYSEGDYYFVTVVDPKEPLLPSPPMEPYPEYDFVQDVLLKNGMTGPQGPEAINGILNYFILRWRPLNFSSIMVFLNGVKLTNGYDYTLIDRGFTVPPIVKFNLDLKSTDWVVANYMSGTIDSSLNSDFSKYFVDTLVVENITVDTNPGYVLTLNSNTISGKQELYCSQPISPTDSIIVFINGVELVQNQQFFLSKTEDNRIIFNNISPIVLGDVVSIFAVSPNFILGGNNYGSLEEPTFMVQWGSIPTLPDNVTGKFIVQIFDKDDISNTVLYQQETEFVSNKVNYDLTFNSLALDLYYRFRVTFQTTYTTYLNNEITTCSYSEGYFDTVNEYINNTY